jgi:hypothetical protein
LALRRTDAIFLEIRRTGRLWDSPQIQFLHLSFLIHCAMSTDVFCSAFSPSGDRFVCGTSAGKLHIAGAAETRTVSVGSGRVYALQFMSNEQVAMYDCEPAHPKVSKHPTDVHMYI